MSVPSHCLLVAATIVLLGCKERPAKPVPLVVNNAVIKPAVSSHSLEPTSPIAVTPETEQLASEDHQRIQGTWNFVTLVNGPTDRIVMTQDKVTFHVRDKTVAGSFALDSTAQPKRIDLTFAANPDGPVSPQGIYEFRQDLLVICLATVDGFRPTEFKSDERQNLFLLHRPMPEND